MSDGLVDIRRIKTEDGETELRVFLKVLTVTRLKVEPWKFIYQ